MQYQQILHCVAYTCQAYVPSARGVAGVNSIEGVVGRSVVGESAIGRSVVGESAIGRSVVGKSAIGRSIVGRSVEKFFTPDRQS